ncbi:hypothetical protein [Aporhodopirellula aestuarii]|uniref:Lipoprotein n=1 Tax=Aporhodopirellula aestuarii TaxID=2950107 RepID=A0ABT0U879_9BACT|nr:hypothetical protein [Aporhodopirellula aestuarii]MCM2372745.1 hypothetical protein [Aporhodopirellula aestuarii]
MRSESISGLLLGLSMMGCFSGCGPQSNQQADAGPGKSAVGALPNSVPHEKAAKAADPLDEVLHTPATTVEAAAVIDLSTFPLLPDAGEITTRTVACLEYEARLKAFGVRNEYEFQRRNLLERQWEEWSESDISNGYAEGQFVRSGFHLYVTVQLHDEPGKVVVRLKNKSNVNVSKLPVPPGATFVSVNYNIASYETSVGVEETREAVRKLLTDHGWNVLGWRGNSLILQQNAVELTAVVEELSRKSGKTRIAYWTEQLSTDSRAPADANLSKYEVQDNAR